MPPKAKKEKAKAKPKSAKQKIAYEEAIPVSMESIGHPEIFPLVLTTKTQEIFGCRAEEDVTEERPNKLIKKEDIIQDFRNRAGVSDFHPVKKIVMEYPGEELLVVYDKEFKYGQNFYLIGTEEAKESILNPPEEQMVTEEVKETVEEVYVYKPPVPKPWVSLGSEKEIEEESVHESTVRAKYKISRERRQFGAPIEFGDHNASSVKENYIECTAYTDNNFTVKQLEKDIAVQMIPILKDKHTQTQWKYPRNAAIQYMPREFSEEERETLLKSTELKDFLNSVSLSVEVALQQNEIMNVFIDDWKLLAEEETTFGDKTDSHLKEYQSFTDLHNIKDKTITCICWHPTIPGLIAVSVAQRYSYEERVHYSSRLLLQPSLILFWSFSDPIHPQLMLQSPEDIFCFRFCPTNPDIIAGGCINGQVVLWDISAHAERIINIKGSGGASKKAVLKPIFLLEPDSNKEAPYVRHCAVSSIERGHKKIITDLHWLTDNFELNRMGYVFENRSGISCQLVTCSIDCTICFWDIRPTRPPPTPTDKKKEETVEVPHDVPSTFLHLDLSWRPHIRITLAKSGTTLDHCPVKLSFREDYLLYHAQDAQTLQQKALIAGEDPYHNLESGLAKILRPMEDYNTKFFVGTEDGEVIYADWKMERDHDSGRLISQKPTNRYLAHDGSIHTVQRSPFYQDIVLTIGGWNVAIWKEGVPQGPLLQSACSAKRYTAGHWSLTRPGVFFVGKEDGYIDIWDLLEKTHEPAQSQNICITSITYIRPWMVSTKQQFVAIADYYGTLHILEIPWTLSRPSSSEVQSVNNYFDKEVSHLRYTEKRKEIREKERAEMQLESERKKVKVFQKSREQIEAELRISYEEYLSLERQILGNLGVLSDTDRIPSSFRDLL
ncbi:dynein intermediate chain 3, axonemal [Trichosurus vulpecula]|uniref:dynein intermediate chain 3, axonemal n=1 Tax=Trichosurus vulpecula TaxID=9337 RepID=UPI00186B2CF9|nr:dynein intermediate chain 3, axonemal [Trichosurus vulpecula]XP_036613229.1 dynein intermediate chain 3, axonemal [Trichosurus vulpecula]